MSRRSLPETFDSASIVRKCSSLIRSIEVGLKRLEADLIASLAIAVGAEQTGRQNRTRQKSPSDLEWHPPNEHPRGPRVKYGSKSRNRQTKPTVNAALNKQKTGGHSITRCSTDVSHQNPLSDRQQLLTLTPKPLWSAYDRVIETFIDTLKFPARWVANLPDSRRPSNLELSCLRSYASGLDLDADWDDPEWGSVEYYTGLIELFPRGERFLPFLASYHGVRLFSRAIQSKWFPNYLASHLVSVALDMRHWQEAEYIFSGLVSVITKFQRSSNPSSIVPFPFDAMLAYPDILVSVLRDMLVKRSNLILEPWFFRFWKHAVHQQQAPRGLVFLTLEVLELALGLPALRSAPDGDGQDQNNCLSTWLDSLCVSSKKDAASLAQNITTILIRDFLRASVISKGESCGGFEGLVKVVVARITSPSAFRLDYMHSITRILFLVPLAFASPSRLELSGKLIQAELSRCLLEADESGAERVDSESDEDEDEGILINDMASSLALLLFSLQLKHEFSEAVRLKFKNRIRSWLWRLGTFLFQYAWLEQERSQAKALGNNRNFGAVLSTGVREIAIITRFISSTFGHLASLDDSYPWSEYETSIDQLLASMPGFRPDLGAAQAGEPAKEIKPRGWNYDDVIGTWVAHSPELKRCGTRYSKVTSRPLRYPSRGLLLGEQASSSSSYVSESSESDRSCRQLRKRGRSSLPLLQVRSSHINLPRGGKRARRSLGDESFHRSFDSDTSGVEEDKNIRGVANFYRPYQGNRNCSCMSNATLKPCASTRRGVFLEAVVIRIHNSK